MVDFLRIFRRRGPVRGRQGFARSRPDEPRRDITALGGRMGDLFKAVIGETPAVPREPSRDAAPVRREAVAAVSREPASFAPAEPSAFALDAPPIPRSLPREDAPRPRNAANGAAPPRPRHAGYLAIHGVE